MNGKGSFVVSVIQERACVWSCAMAVFQQTEKNTEIQAVIIMFLDWLQDETTASSTEFIHQAQVN